MDRPKTFKEWAIATITDHEFPQVGEPKTIYEYGLASKAGLENITVPDDLRPKTFIEHVLLAVSDPGLPGRVNPGNDSIGTPKTFREWAIATYCGREYPQVGEPKTLYEYELAALAGLDVNLPESLMPKTFVERMLVPANDGKKPAKYHKF